MRIQFVRILSQSQNAKDVQQGVTESRQNLTRKNKKPQINLLRYFKSFQKMKQSQLTYKLRKKQLSNAKKISKVKSEITKKRKLNEKTHDVD